MIHCNAVAVVSVPPLRNSEHRLTTSPSVRLLPCSSGRRSSSRESTYATAILSDSCFSFCSCRARISAPKISCCFCFVATHAFHLLRNKSLVTVGKKAKTGNAVKAASRNCCTAWMSAIAASSSSFTPKHMNTSRQKMACLKLSITTTTPSSVRIMCLCEFI
ncbi:hypothetical protein ACMD2_01150 [Ananas comosus]|uniref:Uncharacterized protein n=1 Tax=Ananas comosus TaxID=4615 RepID=A0A199UCV0_ANACO|nr:hypothetical protein ACMD2_01150 [Ananas comosus]